MRHLLSARFTLELAALMVLGVASPGFVVAAPADFAVTEAGGANVFQLSKAKGSYVALHFLLKTDCPICLQHVREYAAKAGRIPGVQHVFLKPDSEEEIVKWAAGLSPDDRSKAPRIYRDPEAQLAKQFNIPDGYAFHGETVHYPAFVLLDSSGKEAFRYVGGDTTDRFGFDRFAAKMDELTREARIGHYNLDKNRLAIQGYDPVAYFNGGPKKGSKELTASYAGATYRFADEKNRDAFQADPAKYLPEYGGWCASAMAFGKKVEIDPENYKITGGRLFLFYKSFIQDALKDWNKNEAQWTVDADRHWKEISGETPRALSRAARN